jgi:hypothetical protein
MATSGMAMPAFSACLRTVSTSQNSVEVEGLSMMRAPVDHLAIIFDMASEMKAPPKPMMPAKTSSVPRLRPFAVRYRFTPSTLAAIDSTSITARLVTRNSTMRFIS